MPDVPSTVPVNVIEAEAHVVFWTSLWHHVFCSGVRSFMAKHSWNQHQIMWFCSDIALWLSTHHNQSNIKCICTLIFRILIIKFRLLIDDRHNLLGYTNKNLFLLIYLFLRCTFPYHLFKSWICQLLHQDISWTKCDTRNQYIIVRWNWNQCFLIRGTDLIFSSASMLLFRTLVFDSKIIMRKAHWNSTTNSNWWNVNTGWLSVHYCKRHSHWITLGK